MSTLNIIIKMLSLILRQGGKRPGAGIPLDRGRSPLLCVGKQDSKMNRPWMFITCDSCMVLLLNYCHCHVGFPSFMLGPQEGNASSKGYYMRNTHPNEYQLVEHVRGAHAG